MSCQTCESSAWDRGIFGPFLGPRRYIWESVLGSRASEGEGSAQGLNRTGRMPGFYEVQDEPDGSGDREGSGQLESIEGSGRCSGRCSGGQAEMGEHLDNDGGSTMAPMILKEPPQWGHC